MKVPLQVRDRVVRRALELYRATAIARLGEPPPRLRRNAPIADRAFNRKERDVRKFWKDELRFVNELLRGGDD